MKKLFLCIFAIIVLSSCKPLYLPDETTFIVKSVHNFEDIKENYYLVREYRLDGSICTAFTLKTKETFEIGDTLKFVKQ